MSKRHAAATLAACALLAVGGIARAADPVPTPGSPTAPTPPAAAEPAAFSPDSVIGMGLDKLHVSKPLADMGIKITGYVEGSYTYNLRSPASNINEARAFDFEHDAPRLNQLELMIQRAVDPIAAAKDKKYDIGFTVDMGYGRDDALIHANGLNGYKSVTHPINQFDLTQAYLEFALPFMKGVDIKVGKFVTPFGYEVINPTGNPLFSHSYSFGFGIPFTQTGVLAAVNVTNDLTISGGFTRGWDQATNDNNGTIDFLGGAAYVFSEEFKVAGNVSIGAEKFRNNSDYRYTIEVIPTYTPKNSPWVFAADGLYAWEEHSSATGSTAYWYGVTGYVQYKLEAMHNMFTPNFRAEWFRDDGGSRLGVSSNFYEFTLGCTIKPFPTHNIGANLSIRPEIRYDYANKAAFDGGRKHDQTTVAVDAIFAL